MEPAEIRTLQGNVTSLQVTMLPHLKLGSQGQSLCWLKYVATIVL